MSDVQTGHEHQTPRGAVLELSTPMLERLDAGRRQELVASLVELSHRHGEDEDTLADVLGATLERIGVPQPRPVVARLVENLGPAERLTIVTDRGEVLHGAPGFDISRQDTGVESTEDPEHGDRPLYS